MEVDVELLLKCLLVIFNKLSGDSFDVIFNNNLLENFKGRL